MHAWHVGKALHTPVPDLAKQHVLFWQGANGFARRPHHRLKSIARTHAACPPPHPHHRGTVQPQSSLLQLPALAAPCLCSCFWQWTSRRGCLRRRCTLMCLATRPPRHRRRARTTCVCRRLAAATQPTPSHLWSGASNLPAAAGKRRARPPRRPRPRLG